MNYLNRKILLFLILLCVISAFSFAHLEQPEFKLSAGGGMYFFGEFGGGYYLLTKYQDEHFEKPANFGIGACGFFDLHFIELNLGFFKTYGKWDNYYNDGYQVDKYYIYGLGLDIGIFLKFPFVLNDRFSSFPLLGVNYRALFTLIPEEEFLVSKDSSNHNTVWFKFGGGLDYSFRNNKYLRTELFYGFRLHNKWEKDQVESNRIDSDSRIGYIYCGHGPDIKLAIGFIF